MDTQGQITPDTKRGQIIKSVLNNSNCQSILEIGTWKGLGTTLCILESINNTCNFITLESNIDMYNIAKNNLKNYKLTMIYGSIVKTNEILKFVKEISINEEQKIWLAGDINELNKCPYVLDLIPNKLDFLLLDGGEFSTYLEWLKLKDRSTVVALDDITQLKTNRIFNELKKDNNYDLVDMTDEGNGFAIFKKK